MSNITLSVEKLNQTLRPRRHRHRHPLPSTAGGRACWPADPYTRIGKSDPFERLLNPSWRWTMSSPSPVCAGEALGIIRAKQIAGKSIAQNPLPVTAPTSGVVRS